MIFDKIRKYNTILEKFKKDIDIPSIKIKHIISWTETYQELVNKEKLITKTTNIHNTIIELIDSVKEILNEIIKS